MTLVAQAGGVVVRSDGDRLSVLLVRAKKNPAIWIFPKGHIERGESAEEAALREVREEAGVTGELVEEVGDPLEFQSGDERVRVRYFLIRALTESPDTDGREKRWFTADAAIDALPYENARGLLRAALARLKPGATADHHGR